VDFHTRLFQDEVGSGKDELGGFGDVFRCLSLHGKMAQSDRKTVFASFGQRPGEPQRPRSRTASTATAGSVLFTTDVAARGLDLPAVDWIVQYDPPSEVSEYVHRVGRTARAGLRGKALLFLAPEEQGFLDVIGGNRMSERRSGKILEEASECPHTWTAMGLGEDHQHPRRKGGGGGRDMVAKEMQYFFEMKLDRNDQLKGYGANAYHAFVRSYAAHSKELKQIFHYKSLHLGHVAKSFAMREIPTKISQLKELGADVEDGITEKKLVRRNFRIEGKSAKKESSKKKGGKESYHLDFVRSTEAASKRRKRQSGGTGSGHPDDIDSSRLKRHRNLRTHVNEVSEFM